jgi:endothelin-converting enzyme
VDREEWFISPQTVNAFYSPNMNEIVFPAAILQPPFFIPEADDAVNYGAIGAIIGHELTHGFDDQGRKSDGEGNLRDWWKESDATRFQERAQVLIAQYERYYPVESIHINGELTLGENIADLGGLTIAYHAYVKSLKGKKAPVIDGFSGEQRLFIGFARIQRGKIREEKLRERLLTDPHSPGQYRVNGVVSNMPEFYDAFNVKIGDELYRSKEERAEIW